MNNRFGREDIYPTRRRRLKAARRDVDTLSMLERFIGGGFGTITIELAVAPLEFGDTAEGVVTLEAKQSIGPGLLTIALVCQERQSRVVPVKNGRRIGASRPGQQSRSMAKRDDRR